MSKIPLRYMMPIIFAVTGIAIILVYYLVASPSAKTEAMEFARQQAQIDTQLLQGRLNQSVPNKDPREIHLNMFIASADDKVQAAYLVRRDGEIAYAYRTRLRGKHITDVAPNIDFGFIKDFNRHGEIELKSDPQSKHLLVTYATVSSSFTGVESDYVLVIVFDYAHLIKQLTRISAQPAELLVTQLLLITLFVGYLLRGHFKRRLTPLLIAAERIGRGESQVVTNLQGGDEFAELGYVIDQMASEVETSRYKLAEALRIAEEANESKSDFIANISHELRAPLINILGFLELIEGVEKDPKHRDYLLSAQSSASVLLNMIDDLVDLSNLDSSEQFSLNEPLNLTELVHDVTDTLNVYARGKGVQLEPSLCQEDIWIESDSKLLRQILTNLTTSAVRHSGESSVRMEVSTREIDEHFCEISVDVRETGIGFPFTVNDLPFNQLEDAGLPLPDEWRFTTLGLKLVDGMTRLLDGELRMTSTPGKGTQYNIRFTAPVYPADSLPKPTPQDEQSNEPLQVLIIDRSPDGRRILNGQLTRHGARVTVAETPEIASAEMNKRLVYANLPQFDVAVIDLHGPTDCGIGCINNLRGSFGNLPCVALYSSQPRRDEHAALLDIYDSVLVKPVSGKKLFDEIIRVKNTPRKKPIDKLTSKVIAAQ